MRAGDLMDKEMFYVLGCDAVFFRYKGKTLWHAGDKNFDIIMVNSTPYLYRWIINI
jgi:hypothetical protein